MILGQGGSGDERNRQGGAGFCSRWPCGEWRQSSSVLSRLSSASERARHPLWNGGGDLRRGFASRGGWRIARRTGGAAHRLAPSACSATILLGLRLPAHPGERRRPRHRNTAASDRTSRSTPGREPLTVAAIAGVVVAFCGRSFFSGTILPSPVSGRSVARGVFIFASGAAWAFYVVTMKPLILRYGPLSASGLSIIIAAVPMLIVFGSQRLLPRRPR